jgi:hypothetical protein
VFATEFYITVNKCRYGSIGDWELAGGVFVTEEVEDFNGTVEGTSIEGGPDRRDGRPEEVEVVDEGAL